MKTDLENVIKSNGTGQISKHNTEQGGENGFPTSDQHGAETQPTLPPDNSATTQPPRPNLRGPPSLRRVGHLKIRPKPLGDLSVARYAGGKTAIQGMNVGTPTRTPDLESYLAAVYKSNPPADDVPSEDHIVQTPIHSNLPVSSSSSLLNPNSPVQHAEGSSHYPTPVTMGASFHRNQSRLMDRSPTRYVPWFSLVSSLSYTIPPKRETTSTSSSFLKCSHP